MRLKLPQGISLLIVCLSLLGLWSRFAESLYLWDIEWVFWFFGFLLARAVWQRYWLWSGLVFLLWLFLGLQLFWWNPQHLAHFRVHEPANSKIRFQGKVVEVKKYENSLRLTLAQVELETSAAHYHWNEVKLEFPYTYKKIPYGVLGNPLGGAGVWTHALLQAQIPKFYLQKVHFRTLYPTDTWTYPFEIMRQRLQDRARFYLSDIAYSLFIPLTLGFYAQTTEAIQTFRQTGVIHMLSISGMHFGVLYLFCFWIFKQSARLHPTWYLTSGYLVLCRSLPVLILWLYLFLIGAPVAAIRTAVMLTVMVLISLLGIRQVSLFSLILTAGIFLGWDATVIHDISFQLSFLSVFFLLFCPFPRSTKIDPLNLGRRLLGWASEVTWYSVWIGLGIWPITVNTFHYWSFEMLWLNLVLAPIMIFIVMPFSILALIGSAFFLSETPFQALETLLFEGAELALNFWWRVLEWCHNYGKWAMLEVELDWAAWQWVLYYSSLIGLVWACSLLIRSRGK